MHVRPFALCLQVLLLCGPVGMALAQFTLTPDAAELLLDKGLVVDGVTQYARRPINTDAVVAGLADGSFDPGAAKAGDVLIPEHAWREIAAEGGAFDGARPGTYILMHVSSPDRRVMMLEASGHAMMYVNGEPRVGDPYAQGYAALPVLLREGDNTLLFAHAARGPMRATLRRPASDVIIADRDLTLPDVVPGEGEPALLSVPIVNAGLSARTITIRCEGGGEARVAGPFTLPACTITKVPLAVQCVPGADARTVSVRLTAVERGETTATREVTIKVAAPTGTHKRTYTSRVDGSVQYMSIVPPAPAAAVQGEVKGEEKGAPGLVLSLHGAGVEATSQAGSYAAKPGLVIACPTNRRPFGFDWEDWGRIDAIEVMDLVKGWYATDPTRQYLTGHSMGGHGTWNIGVLYPERFAAIAPSAGWLSFDSYVAAGGPPHAPDTELGKAFGAARAASMTLNYFENLRGKGIFILHGDADDNVPVEQARAARAALDKLGIAYGFHEQPGAGHWWDDDKPGAACLDWPAIWDTFAKATLAPGGKPSVAPPLDGRGFVIGSFKRVFDRGFVLVYSTGGTAAENAWAFAKARFDAEQWWYRGNGYAPLVSDAEFIASPTGGNVILYGNADTNRAWSSVVGSDSAHVSGSKVRVDGRTLQGADLACLLTLPRKGSDECLVGVIGGTGLPGMRGVERFGYFSSGVGVPEMVVLRAGVWRDGFDGVEGAGRVGSMVWK